MVQHRSNADFQLKPANYVARTFAWQIVKGPVQNDLFGANGCNLEAPRNAREPTRTQLLPTCVSQRLLVTCIASNWPWATVFLGTRLGSPKSGNQIPV